MKQTTLVTLAVVNSLNRAVPYESIFVNWATLLMQYVSD